MAARQSSPRAFTLTELMVAVIILLVVIVATSKIFGTASQVTGLGQAGAEVLQEASAIGRRMRSDFEALSPEGFIAIRCVAVRNRVNLASGGVLLDPELKPDDWVRADQIVFFANGVQSVQGYRSGAGIQRKGQGTVARVYYGHAFQVIEGPPAVQEATGIMNAIDLIVNRNDPVVPWYRDPAPFRNFQKVRFKENASVAPYDYSTAGSAGAVNVSQPPAMKWLMARQAVALLDDGGLFAQGGANVYLAPPFGAAGGVRSTAGIADDVIVNGRVDAAAARQDDVSPSGLGGIRYLVTDDGSGVLNNWYRVQRDLIGGMVFYPRADRHAPSMNRVDQALTSHTLSTACSSFIVDWTYADHTGSTTAANGVRIVSAEQPWFGLSWGNAPGVDTFTNYVGLMPGGTAAPVYPQSIERFTAAQISIDGQAISSTAAPNDIVVYEAFFGYNREHPLDANNVPWGFGLSDPGTPAHAYTPQPTAIRVTMTLHDPEGKLATGRVVQMVFDLPGSG